MVAVEYDNYDSMVRNQDMCFGGGGECFDESHGFVIFSQYGELYIPRHLIINGTILR